MQEMSPKTESQQNANQSSTYELLWSFLRKKEALYVIQNTENNVAFNSPHTIQKCWKFYLRWWPVKIHSEVNKVKRPYWEMERQALKEWRQRKK